MTPARWLWACALAVLGCGTDGAPQQTPNVIAQAVQTAVCPTGSGAFVLYYGTATADLERIRQAAPNFVVLANGLGSSVVEFFHASGIRVLEYVATGYGRNDVDGLIARSMSEGFDGVFFDEVDSAADGYNAHVAQLVRAAGQNRLVVVNPGIATVSASLFDYADIVSTENQYNIKLSPDGIPSWRWLAVQGDPARLAPKSLTDALARLQKFRARGGFWYYSTGRKAWVLPSWFDEFIAQVGNLGNAPCPTVSEDAGSADASAVSDASTVSEDAGSADASTALALAVSAVDDSLGGAAVPGLCVYLDATFLCEGFTPLTRTIMPGDHLVGIGEYGTYRFVKWNDGSLERVRLLEVQADLSMVAHMQQVSR